MNVFPSFQVATFKTIGHNMRLLIQNGKNVPIDRPTKAIIQMYKESYQPSTYQQNQYFKMF